MTNYTQCSSIDLMHRFQQGEQEAYNEALRRYADATGIELVNRPEETPAELQEQYKEQASIKRKSQQEADDRFEEAEKLEDEAKALMDRAKHLMDASQQKRTQANVHNHAAIEAADNLFFLNDEIEWSENLSDRFDEQHNAMVDYMARAVASEISEVASPLKREATDVKTKGRNKRIRRQLFSPAKSGKGPWLKKPALPSRKETQTVLIESSQEEDPKSPKY